MTDIEVPARKMLEPLRGLRPVETAFKFDSVPLSPDGTLPKNAAAVLEKTLTLPGHVYSMTFRFQSGGGTAPAYQQIAETEGDVTTVPPNAKRAIEIGVIRAIANDGRSLNNFKVVDVTCFPREWDWGKNPER